MRFNIFFLSVLLISCGTNKEISESSEQPESTSTEMQEPADNSKETENTEPTENTREDFNFIADVQEYIPWCKGMAPRPEERNRHEPYSGSFVIVDTLNENKITVNCKNGTLKAQLEPGTYLIKESFKDCSFEEFYKNHSLKPEQTSDYMQDRNEECYKNWWSSALAIFTIPDEDTIISVNIGLSSSCFTGNNPCLMYKGPYPP